MRVGRTRYVSKPEKECEGVIVTIIFGMFVIAVPIALIYSEVYMRETMYAFEEVKNEIRVLPNDVGHHDSTLNGHVVYLNSKHIKPNSVLVDPDFQGLFFF